MSERLDRIEKILEQTALDSEKRNKEAVERNKEAENETRILKKILEERNKEADKRIKKLEQVMNGIGLTQGDISEELIADNFGNVFREVGEDISSIERNLKIYSGGRVKGEFDIIGVNGTKVFVGETKTKLTKAHIDKLVDTTIPNFKKYDNRHAGMTVYGVIGARVFSNEDVKDYAIKKGLYIIKETHKGTAKILKESLKGVKSF